MELKVIPVVQVVIVACLMVLTKNLLSSLDYSWQYSNNIAIAIFILGILIAFLAIYCFSKHQTTVNPTKPESSTSIVNSGIYAFSRNPMYLAMLLSLIAFALFLENIAAYYCLPIFVAYISHFQIIPEERILQTLFGQEYLTYKNTVRRWL